MRRPGPLPEGEGMRRPDLHGENITFGRGVASGGRKSVEENPGRATSLEAVAGPGSGRDGWEAAMGRGVAHRPNRRGRLVNLRNYRRTSMSVKLVRGDKIPAARDVLTGSSVAEPFCLQPLEVRLLRLERN